jgi:hypothetical protein
LGVRFADSFQSFAQHETMLPWKATCVITTPKDQVVGLGDDDQFFPFLHLGLRDYHSGPMIRSVKETDGDFK